MRTSRMLVGHPRLLSKSTCKSCQASHMLLHIHFRHMMHVSRSSRPAVCLSPRILSSVRSRKIAAWPRPSTWPLMWPLAPRQPPVQAGQADGRESKVVASLLLVAMPFVPSSFLLLGAMPGAPEPLVASLLLVVPSSHSSRGRPNPSRSVEDMICLRARSIDRTPRHATATMLKTPSVSGVTRSGRCAGNTQQRERERDRVLVALCDLRAFEPLFSMLHTRSCVAASPTETCKSGLPA